jgi:hypothetical protein
LGFDPPAPPWPGGFFGGATVKWKPTRCSQCSDLQLLAVLAIVATTGFALGMVLAGG